VFCLLVRRDGSAGSSPRGSGRLATCPIGLDVASGADTHVVGSVAERAVVERALSNHGIEAVVHAGALHKPDIARRPGRAFIDVNVTGTLNLLEAAVAAGHDRFVFTSTTSLMARRTSVRRPARLQFGSTRAWGRSRLGISTE
jgi:nucleoside-diphosphate-sugar epimerase